ncbi:hypothetical protein AAVH_35350, partial [Aphelenchoides avenae]
LGAIAETIGGLRPDATVLVSLPPSDTRVEDHTEAAFDALLDVEVGLWFMDIEKGMEQLMD